MEKALLDILEKISTSEDLYFFLEEIEKLRNLSFEKPKSSLLEKSKEKIGSKMFSLLKKWEEEKLIPSSTKEQSFFFQKIEEELQEIPKVKMKTAFQPSEDFISKIRKKIKEILGTNRFILDISVDPKVVGGVVIEYQGKYFDGSLAEKIKIKDYEGF